MSLNISLQGLNISASNVAVDTIENIAQHFVVAVDDSKNSRHAFHWTAFLANPNDKITILHSHENEIESKIVQDRYQKYPKENAKRYKLCIRDSNNSNTNERILDYVNNNRYGKIDFLCTGMVGNRVENQNNNNSKQKNLRGSRFGSTADLSLRSAKCSSIFCKRSMDIPEQNELKIVVGVDGSENSKNAFHTALELLMPGNTLYVVHIQSATSNSESFPERFRSSFVIKNYHEYISNVEKQIKAAVEMKVVHGEMVAVELCKFVVESKSHVLIVGADGMSAHFAGKPILGSVSDACVEQSNSVVIVTQINDYCSTPRISWLKK